MKNFFLSSNKLNSTGASSGLPDYSTFRLHDSPTPKELGYYFPAEFAPHAATWLSWPHKEASWPGKINSIFPYYAQFVKTLALSEQVVLMLLMKR